MAQNWTLTSQFWRHYNLNISNSKNAKKSDVCIYLWPILYNIQISWDRFRLKVPNTDSFMQIDQIKPQQVCHILNKSVKFWRKFKVHLNYFSNGKLSVHWDSLFWFFTLWVSLIRYILFKFNSTKKGGQHIRAENCFKR